MEDADSVVRGRIEVSDGWRDPGRDTLVEGEGVHHDGRPQGRRGHLGRSAGQPGNVVSIRYYAVCRGVRKEKSSNAGLREDVDVVLAAELLSLRRNGHWG